ncbi:unnamed protein product [Rotaria sordida]|uniref:NAD(P)(+)--arginine ADP-ribosyltransferase n=1 Tax=Rotaria sordida TaxID=392033 RepID=A0A819E4T8_9BILA|nr:unnamed protein product [Rotaria sordida]
MTQEIISSDSSNNRQYVIVDWYLQQHGSFSSLGRWRDISLTQFTSTQQLIDYLLQYIEQNYKHVNIIDRQYNVLDLCRIAIDESDRLLASNSNEISYVTSRHIWPPHHKLLMGCLIDAHIVAVYNDQYITNLQKQHDEQENDDTTYCLITQLGNHPTHIKFLRGTSSLREELLQRFKCPFQTNSTPTEYQNELFLHKSQTLSIQEFCNYVTSQSWHELDSTHLYGVLVDFIIAGETLLFHEQIITKLTMNHRDDGRISVADWSHNFTRGKEEKEHVSSSNPNIDIQLTRRTNPRLLTKTIVDDSQKNLLPIIDYALEPLLPLRDACLPLSSIVSDVENYVEIALQLCSQPKDNLTHDELAALYLYTMEWINGKRSLYSHLNRTLRNTSNRDELRPWYKYLKLFLTALAKLPFVSAQVVWRGVKRNISEDFPPGSQIIWWSFSSCTTSLRVLESDHYLGNTGERTLFSIETINGKSIRSYSHFNTEDEMLLLPGTYMEVQSQLNPAPDLYIIHLKQKVPQEILLAPPFESALLYPKMEVERLWYKTKICISSISIFMIIFIVAIIVGAVLGTRTSSPIASSVCKSRQFKIIADILWSFDCSSVIDDIGDVYNGITFNNITYINPDFSGQGKALNLDANNKQYVDIIPSPQFSKRTNFTISMWIGYVYLWGDAVLFNNCDMNLYPYACLTLGISDRNVFMSLAQKKESFFDPSNRLSSNRIIDRQWNYVSFQFDSTTGIISIYINGYFDRSKNLTGTDDLNMFVGNGKTRIGGPISSNISSYIYAQTMLDQISISYDLKNASELLREASLLFHYQFKNSSNINDDSGPNAIQAYSQNVYYSKDGLYFNTTNSFFKTSEFTIIQLNDYTYSIAFWIQISNIDLFIDDQSILIFDLKTKMSLGALEYSCFSYFYWQYNVFHYKLLRSQLGLTISTSNDTTQFEMNKWFHITVIDSPKNGIALYVNGQLSGLYNKTTTITITYRFDITLGTSMINQSLPNMWPCFDSLTTRTQWKGTINDFRFYARQLNQSEILDIIKNQNMTNQK